MTFPEHVEGAKGYMIYHLRVSHSMVKLEYPFEGWESALDGPNMM